MRCICSILMGRGGVLEALITRMKRIRDNKVRIVALSATMPNVREVAQWIGATEERTFAFDDCTAQFHSKPTFLDIILARTSS